MKKWMIITLSITYAIVLNGTVILLILNSNYWYSNKLVSAIYDHDIKKIEQILEKKPGCVNTFPNILPNSITSIIEATSNYPLTIACRLGYMDVVKLLVESGADVNIEDSPTALSAAYNTLSEDWYEISLYLIENGASLDYDTVHHGGVLEDIVSRHPGEDSPEGVEKVNKSFFYAFEHCDKSLIDWNRVLFDSITYDRTVIVEFLLDNQYCGVNSYLYPFCTPLMRAIEYERTDIIQLLLDRGADKTMKNDEGKTAYDIALEEGHTDIAQMVKP